MLDWEDVRYYQAIVERSTIRGAAELLGVSHATVSRRLKTMEQRLSTILFHRHSTGLTASAAGAAIEATAYEIKTKVEQLNRQVFSLDKELKGEVSLSMPEAIATSFLFPALAEFSKRYPAISLKLTVGDKFENLARRDVDIALRLCDSPPDQLIGKKLANSRLCVYGATSYLKAAKLPYSWVSLDYSPAKAMFNEGQINCSVNGLLAMKHALVAGMGVGVLPCFLGDLEPLLTRIPGSKPVDDLSLWLLTHQDVRKVKRVAIVKQYLEQTMLPYLPIFNGLI